MKIAFINFKQNLKIIIYFWSVKNANFYYWKTKYTGVVTYE